MMNTWRRHISQDDKAGAFRLCPEKKTSVEERSNFLTMKIFF